MTLQFEGAIADLAEPVESDNTRQGSETSHRNSESVY
jgi:hypothetical protein